MLHLAIIGIVCAVSAPREGTTIIERKNYGSDAFFHLEERAQKEAKSSSPRVYNVDAHNSSEFAKQKITNRTNSFHCDYNNKQYQNSRSSLCSVMENVFPRKKKESFYSDVGSAFRKRSLLWGTNKLSPGTLRPPMDPKIECVKIISNEFSSEKCKDEKSKCPKPDGKCKKPKSRFKTINKKKFKSDVIPKPYSLKCCQKKNFLRLKKRSGKMHKRHLDRVKIDDELDLNKRIQKLVQEIAAENQRAAQTKSPYQSAGAVVSSGEKTAEKVQKPIPFFKKLKKIFRFNKNSYVNNKQLIVDNPNSVPVNLVRGEVPVADKRAHLNSYDVFKSVRKTSRFRRNPYRNYVSCSQRDYPVYRCREKILLRKPYPFSANLKKKTKFLYPPYKLYTEIRTPHLLLYGPRIGVKPWPYSKQFVLKSNVKDVRSKRHNAKFEKSKSNDAAAKDSQTAQKTVGPEGTGIITTERNHLEKSNDDVPSSAPQNLERSNDKDVVFDHTLERPLPEKNFRYDFFNERGPSADLKSFEDRYNLQTDFPLFDNPTALHPYRRYKYDLPKDGFLNPYRYLKIRHALRNYLIHNNILSPTRLDSFSERKKRCGGGKCCPLPHRCWRSPPLLCIPYVRKGQDDLLRYLIKTMQKMIGKPFPPKIDIFESTKFKPCGQMADHTCDDINTDDGDDCECMTMSVPSPCMSVQPCPPPPPSTSRTYPCQMNSASKICTCSQPLVSIPKPCTCAPAPCAPAPCPPSARPYAPTPRSCLYDNYNPPCDFPPIANAYPSSSQYPYSSDNMEQILYPTQSFCGYNEPPPMVPSPFMPVNPYCRSSLSTPPPVRSLSLSSPHASTDYPPTPPPNTFLRASKQTFATFTRSPYLSASTANACSWYMSKSPIERTEYFAYTALPYNGPPDYVTAPSQVTQTEPFKPANLHPPCSRSNEQANEHNSEKFNVQMGPVYAEHPPAPILPGVNSQPNTERFRTLYENQCKDRTNGFGEAKQSNEVNAEQMDSLRKDAHGQTNAEVGDNLNENPMGTVGCDNQQHRLVENQLLKSEMSSGCSKNENNENVRDACRCADQQVPKAEASIDYSKPLSKEENSPVISNVHPVLSVEANDGGNKNQNREYAYNCGNRQLSLNEQQMPKPDSNIKEAKNQNKEDVFRCSDQQHTSNERQQLPKPEINDLSDDRRFFKTKHHKGILKNFRKPGTEFLPTYDDYYDKYPPLDPEEPSAFKYKSPFLRTWRGYPRKVKKSSKRGSSVRQKRGDNYYAWPDNFENYNDYESDVNYNDESSDDSKTSDEAPPYPNWTPPSYDMFSELAKAVTEYSSKETGNNSSANFSISADRISGKQALTPASVPLLGEVSGKSDDDIQKIIPKVKTNDFADHLNTSSYNSTNPVAVDDDSNTNATVNDISVAYIKPADAINATTNTTSATTSATTNTSPVSTSTTTTTAAVHEHNAGNGESIDSKKSGKTGFFQTNSKPLGIQSNPKFLTTTKAPDLGSAREDKELDGDQELDRAEEGQVPTTLKMTSIVKGPKKLLTKPSPKVYTKVYPDSMAIETEANETVATAAVTTAKAVLEKTTLALGSTSDIQVQLLAVCEGYLEVVKLIKAQNQTLGDDLDANLARYCENIISQNFNLQSDSSKPKKQESIQASSAAAVTNSTMAPETIQSPKKCDNNNSSQASLKIHKNDRTKPEHRGKVVVDILNNPLYKRELYDGNKRKKGDLKMKKLESAECGNENEEKTGAAGGKKNPGLRKNKGKSKKNSFISTPQNSKSVLKKPKRYRRKKQTEEELLKKGITKEQVELLHLLRKRKKALLSWLYNSKEVPNKPSDTQETEYFDDEEEIAGGSDVPSCSGTITRRDYEETSPAPESSNWSFVNESIFPVYAKQYGYDRGGEVMEVEVLWRKINEKTHEKKIFRNRSVLALLLTSTNEPDINHDDTRLMGNGFENEEMSEIQSKSESKIGYVDPVANLNKKTSTAPTITKTKNSSSVNNTYTYIKPDPSSIVGAPPNATTLHPNTSHKISHKFGAAKDLFQEYTLEFLNYAVYILPIMFTVLFVFCCLCCAVQVLKTKKSSKKHKKKKKRQYSTESSETTEDSECESKKKRREARRKKRSKENADKLDKKRSKAFWNVLKMNSTKSNAEFNDDSQTEKKKSFLRFLKGRRMDSKAEFSGGYSPVREVDEHGDLMPGHSSDIQYHDSRRRKDENPKTYSQSEAEERRELIALLEELKKIETENSAEKKEVKSVHVQYMTQEDDSNVFQRPEFAFPYQKNVFGMPKGYSPCNKHFPFYQSDPATIRDYELFENVNELTELLPCECNYYSKRNDYLRRCDFKINQEGGCKSFLKIFRDAGVTRSKPFREKNLFKNENENRSFIFNKYRSISTDTSDELMGVTQKNAGTEVILTDNLYETASPLRMQSKKNTDFVEEMDNSLKRQLKNKKHVRLKDDGVLCRL